MGSSALEVLASCAYAIQDGNLKLANSRLEQIWSLAAQEPDKQQRKVVKYFAEALVRRAYRLYPTIPYNFQWLPYGFTHIIGKAINTVVTRKKRLHLIDFDMPHLYGWGYLFGELANRSADPLSVRVSVILPPFLEKTVNLQEEKQCLITWAKESKVELEEDLKVVYANSLGEVDESLLDLRRTDDEAVVVYYIFKLQTLLAKDGAMEKELLKLRQMNPDIVVIKEQDANHNDPNFIKRLKGSFQYYSHAFRFDGSSYQKIEKYYRRQIHNIVGCEGEDRIVRHETLDQWRSRLLTSGFLPVPLQQKPMLCTIYANKIHEENGCLVLSWENCPLFFISAWTLTHWEDHFNLISYNFSTGFSPIPPSEDTVQPSQVLPEGFSLNRLAAFVEIYDMLEDICSKYELPLALTWTFGANMKLYSYKKIVPCIESTYSYVTDWRSQQFVETCAKQKHFLERQARKALQSNEPFLFEPIVAKSERCDNQFASAADEYGPHAYLVICLQNHYNDVYVVEFFLPASKRQLQKPESLAPRIFNELENMKKMFVRLRGHGTEVGYQEYVTPNIQQGTLIPSSNPVVMRRMSFSSIPVHASSSEISPFNAPNPMRFDGVLETQGLYEQTISNGCEIMKAQTYARPQTRQRRLSSKVWKDFDKFEVNGKQLAKCKHCHKEFTGSSKSGTTHLKNHLERCRSKKKENQERQFPSEMGNLTTRDTNERNSTFDQEESRLDLAKMIIMHQYPLDMVEQEFFKIFAKKLQPTFEFPSQEVILSYIHRIYEEVKEKLKQFFNQLACNFSLTIGLWKDNLGKNSYCWLITHFTDDDWELKTKILAFKKLEHISDMGTLSGIIRSSLSDWNVSKKVCSIAVDNSFLNGDIAQQIKENCLSGQGSFPSCHCFIGCSLIQDWLHKLDDMLLKIRKSVEYVSEKADGKLKLQEAVNQVKLQGCRSREDLPLRLDSDFGSLDSETLGSREIFCQLKQIGGNFKVNPSMEEWDKALALHSCLKGFYDLLNSLEGTQSLTANVYFPMLCDVYKKFLQLEKSNFPFITMMKRKFDEYWSLCNLVFTVAAVLDPRLKFKFVEFSYGQIYDHDRKMQLNKFHKVLTDIYYEYANEPRNLTTSASIFGDFSCSTGQSAQSTANSESILDAFGKYVSASNFNEVTSWKSELGCYLEEPLLCLDGASFDILGWWRVNSERFPTLAKMARDLLAMPVSVVPPCSNFSTMITNPAYSSLSPTSMEALVCSQNWLKMPKENDGANHGPVQIMAKRKMEKKEIHGVKSFETWNYEETSGGDSAKASSKLTVQQEMRPLKSLGPNHGRDINGLIEIPNNSLSFNNQLEFQCSSYDFDGEIAWRLEQGAWHAKDVRAYLISSFTEKENKLLKRWQSSEMSGKLIGQDKEFRLVDYKLAPLLLMPHGVETRVDYYIEDSVVNIFFKLLKKRSDRFPKAYINHYSFDSGIATYLIGGSRSEHEVLAWFKDEKLANLHKLFLPLCLSAHWVLFYVDTKKQRFSWLDSNVSSRMSNDVEKEIISGWFKGFLLPAFGYNNTNEWPFESRTDIPVQNNFVDCGLFVMKYADCLTHGDFFPFTQEDMGHFRHRTFLDIYYGRLHSQK